MKTAVYDPALQIVHYKRAVSSRLLSFRAILEVNAVSNKLKLPLDVISFVCI